MFRLAVVLLTVLFADALLRVVFVSDLHVGENCQPVPYNGTEDCACITNDKRAFAKINELQPPADAVIILGDLTSSAWPTMWVKVSELLRTLDAPYFPLMGNHDVWQYDKEGGNETAGPFGDQAFGSTFGDLLRSSPAVSHYAPRSVHNPLWNTTSTFQNYVVTLVEPETGARLAFVGGDWSTREPAPPPNSGVPGWAERGLSDFPGGTLPWLRTALAAEAALPASQRPDKLFMVQHQPIKCPFYMPDFSFCFGLVDKVLLSSALTEHWPKEAWWGSFAGHIHLFINDTVPFEGWQEFREVQVSAAKGDGIDSDVASAFMVVDFLGTNVTTITDAYYTISTAQWTFVEGK